MEIAIKSKYNIGDEVFINGPCDSLKAKVTNIEWHENRKVFMYQVDKFDCWFFEWEI